MPELHHALAGLPAVEAECEVCQLPPSAQGDWEAAVQCGECQLGFCNNAMTIKRGEEHKAVGCQLAALSRLPVYVYM
jgi:hypothetical protein